MTVHNFISPNNREVLYAKSSITGQAEYLTSTNHVLDTASSSGGVQYADGAARGTATGTLAMGDDGTNIQSVKVDTSGVLAIQDNGGSLTVDGTVGSASGAINVGQKAVSTAAVQISASSTVPTNGVIIGALSTNAASIFIGGSGVTTTTGAEITAGSSLPFTCNLNTLYIISASSTTDKIWWNVT